MSARTTPLSHEQLAARLIPAHRLVLVCYLGLLAGFSLANVLDTEGNIRRWLMQCLPLLLFVHSLVHSGRAWRTWRSVHWRSYSWLCFVTLLYFTWAVTNLMSPFASWNGALTLLLSVLMFCSAMMASRWHQRWWHSRPTP